LKYLKGLQEYNNIRDAVINHVLLDKNIKLLTYFGRMREENFTWSIMMMLSPEDFHEMKGRALGSSSILHKLPTNAGRPLPSVLTGEWHRARYARDVASRICFLVDS
jgi:hypothetical protein